MIGLYVEFRVGDVRAIMGPNGSGKSTFASVLAGKEKFEVTQGEVQFNGRNLLEIPMEDRANEGRYLGFR